MGDEELGNQKGVRGPNGKANILYHFSYSSLFQPDTVVPHYLAYGCLLKKEKEIQYLVLSICENPKLKDV